ncbi:MAG: hypothetical protein AAFY71_02075 [Bacteroidota bacterium]
MKTTIACLCSLLVIGPALAQVSVRKEDQFYKRTVVQRLDLEEKMNLPLRGLMRLPADEQGPNGLVQTLLDGLKSGAIDAYQPDDLSKVLSYDDVLLKIKENEQSLTGGPMETDWIEMEDSTDEIEFPEVDEFEELFTKEEENQADLGPYESVVQIVEEWIFDKNRGMLVPQIKQIQIIWTDPGEVLPEKTLAVFKYGEAKKVLDKARWANRHNEAEHRSLKEALDLRLFHSFIINVSGQGVRSLPEEEQRRLALVEFEHHLWSY